MVFEYVELERQGDLTLGERASSLLVGSGYQSLLKEHGSLVRHFLPGASPAGTVAGTPQGRTIDVLIPPADATARVLVCGRPGARSGTAVAVVAVGRRPEEAHRVITAAKLALDSGGLCGDGLAQAVVNDNGRGYLLRFRQEWVRALGLAPAADGRAEGPARASSSLAVVQHLRALEQAALISGQPSVLRSRAGRTGDPATMDPEVLEGLAAEGLVDKAFVLVCRQTGQLLAVGQDAAEIQQAMQVALRCPYCRSPLGEENRDVLFGLNVRGRSYVQGTRWVREIVEAVLRRHNCETFVAGEDSGRKVDAAACHHEAVLVFRFAPGTSEPGDVAAFRGVVSELGARLGAVAMRGVYIGAGRTVGPDGDTPAMLLVDVSDAERGLDQLLRGLERDNFARLVGTAVDLPRPDPGSLISTAGL